MKNTVGLFFILGVIFCLRTATAGSADCPPTSKIVMLKVTSPGFSEAGPYDPGKIKPGKVFVLDGGKRIKVCLASFDLKNYLSVDVLGAQKPKPCDFVLILDLSNGPIPVVPGTYSPKAGYGKPYWATAEVLTGAGKAGTFFSIGASAGTVELLELSSSKACGTFDLTGAAGRVQGQFTIVR